MKLIISGDDGTVIEQIDLNEWDLAIGIARSALIEEIREAVDRGKRICGEGE